MNLTTKKCAFYYLLLLNTFLCFAEDDAGKVSSAQDFTLKDQFKTEHRVQFPCDRVCVLFMADWASKDDVGGWYYPLRDSYADKPVAMHGVGAAKECPLVLRPVVKSILRKHVEEPIMLDWKDEVIEAYNFERGMVNIFVVSADGEVLLHVHGKANEEDLGAIRKTLDSQPSALPLSTE